MEGAEATVSGDPTITPSAPYANAAAVQRIVDQREARGLEWSIGGHLVFMVLGVISVAFMSIASTSRIFETGLFLVGALLALKGLEEVRRVRNLKAVAMTLAVFDLVVLTVLPVSWYAAVGWTDVSPVFLLKNELFLTSMVLIVVNSLSMRPLYPAMLGWGSVVMYLVILGWVLIDGRVTWTWSPELAYSTKRAHPAIVAFRIIALGFTGAFMAMLAASARRTLREAVEAQVAESEARRTQAETIMQGRMEALTSLVAGIAHEVNTPLGAIASSAGTQKSVADRLRASGAPAPLTAALDTSVETVQQAELRIRQVVRRLRAFARLDQADLEEVSVADEIRELVNLIPISKREGVELSLEAPADLPRLRCRVRAINQAFFTIIENAFEAVEGSGRIRIELRSLAPGSEPSGVEVRIVDDGPGIPSDQLERLFEPRLERRGRRVGMGLGLPAARRIVEDQGGTIEVASRAGEGTTFSLRLPSLAIEADSVDGVDVESLITRA